MRNEIAEAIKLLAEKVDKDNKPDEALKYTQSILNLAHARSVIADSDLREARK